MLLAQLAVSGLGFTALKLFQPISKGMGLDENAIVALKKWRFRPGMNGGRPVDVALNVEVHFSFR